MYRADFKKAPTKNLTVEEAKERYRMGRGLLLKVAGDNGAVRRIGKRIFIDMPIMDEAMNLYME